MPRSNNLRKTTLTNLPADVPNIKIPFPPNITPEQFIRNRPLSRESFRSPNSFFIYRQQLVKQLKLENYNDQMVKVSKWAGILWSNEPNYVKEHYKNIEKNIQKLLNEQYKHEQENPCQTTVFVFEYPYKKEDDEYDINPSTGVESVDSSVASTFASPDWPSISPTIPSNEYFYEQSTNTFPPSILASPTSPTFPNFQFNYLGLNNNVENNNNIENIFSLYDELDDFDDFSFMPDNNNLFPY